MDKAHLPISEFSSLDWTTRIGWLLVGSFPLALPFRNLFELPMAIMAICGLWLLVTKPLASTAALPIKPLAVIFVGIWLPMLLSLPDALNVSRSTQTTLAFLRFPLAGLFVFHALRTEQAWHKLQIILGVALSITALCLVLQSEHGSLHILPAALSKLADIFSHQRGVGHVLAVLSPVYFYWIWRTRQRHRWKWVLLPIYIVAILFAGARAAWIMLTVGIVLFAIQITYVEKAKWGVRIILVMGVLTLVAIGGALQNPFLKARIEQTSGLLSGNYAAIDAATSHRLPIWKVALQVTRDHWINGIGPRGFRYIYPEYGEKDDPFLVGNPDEGPTHPHQLLLEVATETGAIGIVGYLFVLIYFARRMVRSAKQSGPAFAFMSAAFIAIMPINAHMAFYASFWACITWWLMSLSLAATHDPSVEHANRW